MSTTEFSVTTLVAFALGALTVYGVVHMTSTLTVAVATLVR